MPAFEEADANGDGWLSLEESENLGIGKQTFKAEDLDNDGKLNRYDYEFGLKGTRQEPNHAAGCLECRPGPLLRELLEGLENL